MIAEKGSKNIIGIITGVALLILSNHALSADNNVNKDNYWAERAEHLRQELSLTEEQTIKIQHILESTGTAASASHSIWNEIYSVLNDKQRHKYEQLHPAKNVTGQNNSVVADAKFVRSDK